jgi:hypothetical protein
VLEGFIDFVEGAAANVSALKPSLDSALDGLNTTVHDLVPHLDDAIVGDAAAWPLRCSGVFLCSTWCTALCLMSLGGGGDRGAADDLDARPLPRSTRT